MDVRDLFFEVVPCDQLEWVSLPVHVFLGECYYCGAGCDGRTNPDHEVCDKCEHELDEES